MFESGACAACDQLGFVVRQKPTLLWHLLICKSADIDLKVFATTSLASGKASLRKGAIGRSGQFSAAAPISAAVVVPAIGASGVSGATSASKRALDVDCIRLPPHTEASNLLRPSLKTAVSEFSGSCLCGNLLSFDIDLRNRLLAELVFTFPNLS